MNWAALRTIGSLLCAMQSIFSAELRSATINVVLLASPIITYVRLHKRWVEREKEIAEYSFDCVHS